MTRKEDRTLPAVAHAAAIIPPVGAVLGLWAYMQHKDDAHEPAFQGAQAAAYQGMVYALLIVTWVLWGWAYATIFIPSFTALDPMLTSPPALTFSLASLSVPVLLWLGFAAGGLLAAQRVRDGAAYRYPILGSWLEQQELVDPPRDMA
jgi:uncharacterized Tic20 family protein